MVKQKIADGKGDRAEKIKRVQRQERVVCKCCRITDTDIDQMFPCLCQIKVSTGSEFKHESSPMCDLHLTLHIFNILTINYKHLNFTCTLLQYVTFYTSQKGVKIP